MKVTILASTKLPTYFGKFDFMVWKSTYDDKEHILLRYGHQIKTENSVLTRIHSQCITGECFLSLKCDCREQLYGAMKMIAMDGCGMIIYLHQEGRGIGLANKIRAYHLQEEGWDTVEANEQLGFHPDERDYQPAIDLLHHLRIHTIKLISNNPRKIKQLESGGIAIVGRVPLQIPLNNVNKNYLKIKKEKLGHLLDHLKL